MTRTGSERAVKPVVVKMPQVLPPEEGSFPRRRGRPRGSTGSQIQRNKHGVAFLVVSGQRNFQIAKALGVCPKTIAMWLRDPAVEEEIEELRADLQRSTERLVVGLFGTSARRLNHIIRKGSDSVALRAIELLWSAQAPIASGNGARGMNMLNQPTFIHDREDAKAAIELLKAKRREIAEEREERARMEREGLAGS